MKFVYIASFGFVGVFARYFVGVLSARFLPPAFPYGTFIINLVGAFLIGVVFVLGFERTAMSADLRLGIITGFLGGFTTFSSYCLEAVRLVQEAEYAMAALYWGLSPVLGLLATVAGIMLTRRFVGGAL